MSAKTYTIKLKGEASLFTASGQIVRVSEGVLKVVESAQGEVVFAAPVANIIYVRANDGTHLVSPVDIDAVLGDLTRFFSEASHSTEFKVYTTRGREITVTVLDGGPRMPTMRYSVTARTKDGRQASGNPESSIEVALRTLHWHDIGLKWAEDAEHLQDIELE